MLRRILVALAVVVGALLVLVALQPSSFAIERRVTVAAPPALVQRHIESLRAMDVWSPWTKMDPQLVVRYEGPESGVGARSSWEGPQMGRGRLAVVAAEPGRIEMRLEMLSPMAATNRVLFTLAPADAATEVTWRMEGTNGFVGKALTLVGVTDAMVGGPFESGLAALARVAEAEAAAAGPR